MGEGARGCVWGECGLNGRRGAVVSVIGDPFSGAPPSKEMFRTPALGARPELQTHRPPGLWAASWKGARPWAVTASPPAGIDFGFGW